MSLIFEIECALEIEVGRKVDEYEKMRSDYTEEQVRDWVHEEFANWLVGQYVSSVLDSQKQGGQK